MRISQFAKINHTTIDAVRHYMDLNLLLPIKTGGQYVFDARCTDDFNELLRLKSMGFSLNEIREIFRFKRFAKLTDFQEAICYQKLYIDKASQISSQIEMLMQSKALLNQEITRIEEKTINKGREVPTVKMGVPLETLKYLSCPVCNSSLQLSKGQILSNQIFDGILECKCGKGFEINDGIICTIGMHRVTSDFNSNPVFDLGYILNYIGDTNEEYLDKVYKGNEWLLKHIPFDALSNKTIVDLGTGVGFFLRTIYDSLPDSSVYFAVDHDINRQSFLKEMIEMNGNQKNVIFLCCDFLEMPIQKESVDVIFDISGSSNYGFEHPSFLIEELKGYSHNKTMLYGAYIAFKKFSSKSKIPSHSQNLFTQKYLENKITENGYKIEETFVSEAIEKGGQFEDYFVPGESVYSYLVIAKQWG